MVFNPITGRDEEEVITKLESEEGATNSPVNPEGFGSLFKMKDLQSGTPEVKPTVATPEDPLIDKDKADEIEEDLELNRDTFTNIQAKQNAGQTLTDSEKLLLGKIKARRDIGEEFGTIFGEEEKEVDTLLSDEDADILSEELSRKPSSEITFDLKGRGFSEKQIQQVLDRRTAMREETMAKSETIKRTAQLETAAAQAKGRIEDEQRRRTNALQDQTKRMRALRGTGRSSAAESDILALEEKGQDLIDSSTAKINLEQDLMQAKIDGAEADVIAGIQDRLTNAETALQEKLNVQIEETKKINEQLDLDFDKSIETMLGTLDSAGEDISGIDREKSKSLGYLVNEDGSIYFNNAGNTVEFKSTGVPTDFTIAEIDDFATSLAAGKVKFSDLDLDSGNLAKVITAMNTKMDSEPGLSTNRLKAERILKDLGLGTDESSVNTVNNLLKNNSEKDVRDMIATDEFKNASFVAGNQKLFDDLRKDADSFKSIDKTFRGMNEIWEDFKDRPSTNRAAMEQALIIMFNKMLDPGSVVREGEFDRTSQGQSVLNAATGWLTKLAKGGAGITNEAFEDIVNIAKVLHDASLDTIGDLKDSYKLGAEDLGANPDFVDRFFEKGFGDLNKFGDINIDMSDEDILNSLSGGDISGKTEIKSNITIDSSFEDKSSFLDDTGDGMSNFNKGDQTSLKKVGISNIGLGTITQNFGATSPLTIDNVRLADGSIGTPGIDIDGKIGDSIPSPINGKVKSITKSDTGLGNSIIIVDEQGNEHFFNHLSQHSVKEGMEIKEGQAFASIGNSGSVIAGPGGDGSHLDYRVKSSEGWIDPNQFFNS